MPPYPVASICPSSTCNNLTVGIAHVPAPVPGPPSESFTLQLLCVDVPSYPPVLQGHGSTVGRLELPPAFLGTLLA